jgi:hypothetical protein
MEKALSSEDPVLRPALLRAVGRSNDPATAKWLIEDFSDKRLRLSERLMGISLAIAAPPRATGFAWANAHLDSLLKSGAASSWRAACRRWPALLLGRQGPGDHRLASALRQQLGRAGTRSRDRAGAGLRRAQGPARRGLSANWLPSGKDTARGVSPAPSPERPSAPKNGAFLEGAVFA